MVNINKTPFADFVSNLCSIRDSNTKPINKKIALVEVNHFFSHHCALPVILRALLEDEDLIFVPYIPLTSWQAEHETLKFVLQLYSHMGMESGPIKAAPDASHFDAAKASVMGQISCFNGEIWNLTDYEIDGFPIGVHLVETLMQQMRSSEIVQDIDTVIRSIDLVSRYLWWKDYLSANPVSTIICSHNCYEFALPLLAAKDRPIRLLLWTYNNLFNTRHFLPLPHSRNSVLFGYARESWGEASFQLKLDYFKKAEKELSDRARGTLAPNINNDPRVASTDRPPIGLRLNKTEGRLAIGVWSHAFSDAPNTLPKGEFGLLCNPLVSIRAIFETLSRLDCDIYVKLHPNPFEQDVIALDHLLEQFPLIRRLPNELTVWEAEQAGIDCVVSGWGTVCYEARYLGLPVFTYADNLGLAGLGIVDLFDFNWVAGDMVYLKERIDLQRQCNHINLIIEQYVIAKYGWTTDFTCSDVGELPRESDTGLYTLHAFSHWMNTFDHNRFEDEIKRVRKFIKSEKPFLSPFA